MLHGYMLARFEKVITPIHRANIPWWFFPSAHGGNYDFVYENRALAWLAGCWLQNKDCLIAAAQEM